MDENYEAEFFKILLSENNAVQYFVLSPTENTQIEKLLNESRVMEKREQINYTVHVILCGENIPKTDNPIVLTLD